MSNIRKQMLFGGRNFHVVQSHIEKERPMFRACELKDKFCPSDIYRTRYDQSKCHIVLFQLLVYQWVANRPHCLTYFHSHACTHAHFPNQPQTCYVAKDDLELLELLTLLFLPFEHPPSQLSNDRDCRASHTNRPKQYESVANQREGNDDSHSACSTTQNHECLLLDRQGTCYLIY